MWNVSKPPLHLDFRCNFAKKKYLKMENNDDYPLQKKKIGKLDEDWLCGQSIINNEFHVRNNPRTKPNQIHQLNQFKYTNQTKLNETIHAFIIFITVCKIFPDIKWRIKLQIKD